jgi:periplasmic divalent cation tolerance protein
MTTKAVSLYVTAPGEELAARLAHALVEERLVACVNVLPPGTSTYRWEGEVQREPEVVLFCKTTAALADAATARLVELHPYDVPCVVRLAIEGGHGPYLAWIEQAVDGTKRNPDESA